MNYLHHLFESTQLFSVNETGGKTFSEEDSRRHILVISNDELTKDEKIFLGKILGSVKLDVNDVALADIQNAPAFHQLKPHTGFRKLILFGVKPSAIGLNIAYADYAPVDFQDVRILVSESLHRLEENEPSKALLWKALKKMFL